MTTERRTYPAPRRDPVTGEALLITRLEGPNTGIVIEGRFTFGGDSRLDRLSAEHLAFVEVFIKNRGIIKDVEAELGISYPTVRARLDEVIRALGYPPYAESADLPLPPAGEGEAVPGSDDERRALLADLQAGRVSAREAARYMKRNTRNDERRAREEERRVRHAVDTPATGEERR